MLLFGRMNWILILLPSGLEKVGKNLATGEQGTAIASQAARSCSTTFDFP